MLPPKDTLYKASEAVVGGLKSRNPDEPQFVVVLEDTHYTDTIL